jgi:predicted Zn finger-like uncharacterized protein
MAEIRLICPGCAAEYRIPDNAIPAQGREVECSACGNVWHATPRLALSNPQVRAAAELPADPPPLNRRLPASVLDILRDEVEHERRARAADVGEPTPAKPAPAQRPAADPEWPATTITRHQDPRPVDPALPEPAPVPPAPARYARATLVPAAVVNEPVPAPVRQDAPAARAGTSRKRGGYRAGFGLAVMLAAGVVALYLLAPMLADRGAWGDGLMQFRADLDGARFWLQDRAGGLIR